MHPVCSHHLDPCLRPEQKNILRVCCSCSKHCQESLDRHFPGWMAKSLPDGPSQHVDHHRFHRFHDHLSRPVTDPIWIEPGWIHWAIHPLSNIQQHSATFSNCIQRLDLYLYSMCLSAPCCQETSSFAAPGRMKTQTSAKTGHVEKSHGCNGFRSLKVAFLGLWHGVSKKSSAPRFKHIFWIDKIFRVDQLIYSLDQISRIKLL